MRPVTLIFAALALTTLTSAQFLPPLGLLGGLGPLGLLGGLGPLGLLGGLGPLGLLGGIGLGSFGPLGGLGLFGRARLGGIRGRRSVDAVTPHFTTAHEEVSCVLSKELLNCTGPHEIIQCAVEPHTPIPASTSHVKLTDLVFKDKVVNNVPVLRIMPRKLINRLGHKIEHISLYASETLVTSEPGFRVVDPLCFNEVFTLVKELPEKIRVSCATETTTD